jgi:hypothetical protein
LKAPAPLTNVLELSRMPGVSAEMSGDEACRALFSSFTRRHGTLKVIQSKRWGVALLEIPHGFEDYFRSPDRAHLRREFNRAERSGFRFTVVDPSARIDEILEINRSIDTRQGLPMHPSYLDEAKVRRYMERSADVFGVTDASGRLTAYLCIRVCGDVGCVERILGHSDVLRQGVMWVLIAGAVRAMVERRERDGAPRWMMYDTYFGASPGLRQFKQWAGFEPHRVSWSWKR